MLEFTGERIVPEASNCEPHFANKMLHEHAARYLFAAQWVAGKRVLDVGCGVGYGSRLLAERGARSVRALDLSAEAIEHANAFYAHPNVTYKVASATDFDFDLRFDIVTCFELIEHVEEQRSVIKRIRQALKDDGVLIMSTPRALEAKRTHFHSREFSEAEFRALLEESFPQVRLYFENNHFSSLITDHEPSKIELVMSLRQQYSVAQADYFIAVASPSTGQSITDSAQPALVIGDDKYVTLLERDSDVLRKALAEREGQLSELSNVLERERSDALYLKELVAQMQGSTSWILTTPLRRVHRKLQRPLRTLRKIFAYRRQHGARALIKAVRKRLTSDGWSFLRESTAVEALSPIVQFANKYFDVVFAIGCWGGESKRYRVYNIAEGLTKMGYQTLVIPFERISDVVEHNVRADVVVLFRAPFDECFSVKVFLKYAKARDIKVVFDVDDLVFDPDIVDQIDAFRSLSPDEQKHYVAGVHAYRKLLLASDAVTVPTEYLRARVESIGKPAFVVPNSINDEQLAVATRLEAERREKADTVRIGYFSGTRTHQADFAQCADALFDLMQTHANTVLRIVGYLDLDARWNVLSDRIERMEFQPYQTMLRTLNDCDINIAPLELKSVFCQGKSEIKFFEAGMLGVPTIASATETFARVIENGVNGYCLYSPEEWRDAFRALVNSESLRESVGAKAKETALKRFAIDQVAKVAANAYGLRSPRVLETRIPKSFPLKPDSLRIAWIVPNLVIGGGGHRNILRIAYLLSQLGHKMSLYFVGTEQDPQSIKQQIQEHFYPLDCPVHIFENNIRPVDVVFATHWTTVSAALTARDAAREILYFVQDFEPAFSPMGTEYVLAENTYRLGLYHITAGPWCEMILRRDFGAQADHFRFSFDRSTYYPRPQTDQRKRLLFFAKPEMPRRCFELGVMALRHFHKLRPDYAIVTFGSRNASKHKYDFPVTCLDIVPTLDDLARLYSNADVGLVFSTTNPSFIPYEMMACGLPVVDLRRNGNEANYGGRFDIALLADPIPESMAQELAGLVNNPQELKARSEAGLKFIDEFPSEKEMIRRIESLIRGRLIRNAGDKLVETHS